VRTTRTDYSESVLAHLAALPAVAALDVASSLLLVGVAVAIAWSSVYLLVKLFKSQD
jgi:hypothetical protein